MYLAIKSLSYLDPGSGSILVQLLAGGLLGGLFVLVKMFWGRIKAFFKGEKYIPPAPPIKDKNEKK